MDEIEVESHLHRIEACPICGAADLLELDSVRTIHPNSRLNVNLIKCNGCSHWFVSPIPSQDDLSFLYHVGSEYVVEKDWSGAKRKLSIPERQTLRCELRRFRTSKKYLEIGVGGGLLFSHFKSRGYECVGVEPGRWAPDQPGLVRRVEDVCDRRFDVIVMGDVLEHIADPKGFMQFLSNRTEGGVLYACFPNCQSLRARLAVGRWRMVRPFGHLHFFSRRSLTMMLESSGFHVKDLRRTDLVDFRLRSLLIPPRQFPVRLLMLFTQGVWGDQWMVQAQRLP